MIKKELKNLIVELRKILDTNSIYESDSINSYIYNLVDDANTIYHEYPVELVVRISIGIFREWLSEDYDLIEEVE